MKIKDIHESTTSGSIASEASPLGKTQTRAGKLFKGKKTNKPFYEDEVNEADLILVPGHGSKLKPGFIPKDKDRTDHEVEMARSDLYQAAKNAKKVYELIQSVSEEQGLEGWVQEKIIKANDYLNTIREYLEHKTYMQEMTGGVLAGGMSNFEEGVAEGLDPVKRGRLNDLIELYRDATDPGDYYNYDEIEDPDEIIGMIQKEFGNKIADQVATGSYKMHFPRHGIQRSDPLGVNRPVDRITKAGKMYKQDMDYRKRNIKSRMGIDEQGVAEELTMKHQRQHNTQQFPDASNSKASRSIGQAEVPNVPRTDDGHPVVKNRFDGRATHTRVEPTITPTVVKRKDSDRPIPSFLKKDVAEAYDIDDTDYIDTLYHFFDLADRKHQSPEHVKYWMRLLSEPDNPGKRKFAGKLKSALKLAKDSGKFSDNAQAMIAIAKAWRKKHLQTDGLPDELAEEQIDEKKDACYSKVKSRYKVWPSAYASGALVKCRKVGASNWGNSSKK